MTADPKGEALATRLEALAEALRSARLRLQPAEDHRRRSMLAAIDRYLLASPDDSPVPALVAIVGLSGTGKSTILNSLAQREVATTGLTRPTTTTPVMLAHRAHAGRYWSDFMAQVEDRVGEAVELVLGDERLLQNVTLVDTVAPRDGDDELLGLADLCVVVTSASRYADASGWDLIRAVRRSGVPMLFVLNRVPTEPGVGEKVSRHYAELLAAEDFLEEGDPNSLFVIAEQGIQETSRGLPPAPIAGLHKELESLADPEFRSQLLQQARASVLGGLVGRCEALGAVVAKEIINTERLMGVVDDIYQQHVDQLDVAARAGHHAGIDVWSQLGRRELAHTMTRRSGIAAQEAAEAWSKDPTGRRLMGEAALDLWRHGAGTEAEAVEVLEGWLRKMNSLAAERSRRGRIPGRRKRVVRALIGSALESESRSAPRTLVRYYGENGAVAVVRSGRELLKTAFAELAVFDSDRFAAMLEDPRKLDGLKAALDEHGPHFSGVAEW